MSNKVKGVPGFGAPARRSLNVGHGNFVVAEQVVAILESGPLPIRRLRDRAGEENRLVDATAGRKTRSLVLTQSNHLVLSALAPQTLQERLLGSQPSWTTPAQLEVEEGEFVS